jgi:hypothetical protein
MRQIVWYALKRSSAAGNVKRTQSGCPGIHAELFDNHTGAAEELPGPHGFFFPLSGQAQGPPHGFTTSRPNSISQRCLASSP